MVALSKKTKVILRHIERPAVHRQLHGLSVMLAAGVLIDVLIVGQCFVLIRRWHHIVHVLQVRNHNRKALAVVIPTVTVNREDSRSVGRWEDLESLHVFGSNLPQTSVDLHH